MNEKELLLGLYQGIKDLNGKVSDLAKDNKQTQKDLKEVNGKVSNVIHDNKRLEDSFLHMKAQMANGNCNPSMPQTVSQEQGGTGFVSPSNTIKNPYATPKTKVEGLKVR